MNVFSRNGITYCNAIYPYSGYKRKRYRPRFRFPDVNAVDAMGVAVALISSAAFVAVFLNWFFN